jgi:hypothetical protein
MANDNSTIDIHLIEVLDRTRVLAAVVLKRDAFDDETDILQLAQLTVNCN